MKKKYRLTAHEIDNIFTNREPGEENIRNFFSVLVPVVEKDGRLFLLYEVRAKDLDRQPGEICFPGGRMEDGEDSRTAALRETEEEIGIPADNVRIVNRLDTINTYSNFLMYCWLGIIDEEGYGKLNISRDEVDEVFLVPLDEIVAMEPEVYDIKVVPQVSEDFPYDRVSGGKPYNWRGGRSTVPVYEIDGRVIWGLTARVTRCFADAVKAGEEDHV